MKTKIEQNKHKIDLLFKIVKDHTGISKDRITSRTRLYKVVIARNTIGVMLHSELGMTIMSAGEVVNRDHASIHHYVRNHVDKMKYDSFYRDVYTEVSNAFWSLMSKADVNDISLRIKSLHREILQLKRTQELIQAK